MSTAAAAMDRADFSAPAPAATPEKDDFRPVLPVINLAAAWLLAIVFFGYPALILPALAAVPTVFYILIRLTMGR
ncbi:hypothetical protein ACLB6G_03985 [Zhengella sp. ZM62]|uniref:hypothetical protein n=1 Tax=Zhengella sedimenti TaxID=3390035 RepID=UPI003975E83A